MRKAALCGMAVSASLMLPLGTAAADPIEDQARPLPSAGSRVAGTNDPFRSYQWHLDQLGVENLWWQNVTGKGVTVAVVDTGVNGHHPDLRGRVLPGWDAITGKRGGWKDPVGHGTQVASQIAAIPNNGVGIAGMAPGVKILPIKITHRPGGRASHRAIARGIRYAVKRGAQVVNVSYYGPFYGRPDREVRELRAAIAYAVKRHVVVVACAGNDRQKGNHWNLPASVPGVLAAAATAKNRRSTSFSNRQRYVRIAAPGQQLPIPTAKGRYVLGDGTSFSSPLVAAEAAMIIQASGGRRHGNAVINTILRTADDVEARGRDSATGYGIINPQRAVADARRR